MHCLEIGYLQVELNEAWKVKAGAGSHSTDLPKRKSQAKWVIASIFFFFLSGKGRNANLRCFDLIWFCRYEAVTLPDNEEGDAPEIERFLNFSNTATTVMGLQPQGAYICVVIFAWTRMPLWIFSHLLILWSPLGAFESLWHFFVKNCYMRIGSTLPLDPICLGVNGRGSFSSWCEMSTSFTMAV